MPLAYIRPVGEHGLYHIHVIDQVDPGFGGGRPGGVDPGYGHGGVRPERPDHSLPGSPGHPDNALPGAPGSPGNELPANPPPTIAPGTTLVMVRSGDGKWHYAAIQPGVPVQPLPEPPNAGVWPKPRPPGVDNTLPGGAPVYPSQGLPPTAAPKPA